MDAPVQRPSLGVLNLHMGEKNFRLSRYAPSEEVGAFIKHYWIVSWDLTHQAPYLQDVVPNPCVNLVVEPNKTFIYGAAKSKFSYFLQGKGLVFGVKFKPGGFYPFIKRPVSALTGNPLDVKSVFGVEAAALEQAILSLDEDTAMAHVMDELIRGKLPEPDPNIPLINEIIDGIQEDRDILKVDDVSERFHMNKRKLQRLFDQYVGLSPKWVIKLYRLQNAAEAVDTGPEPDWAKFSADLGYYDQSHFIKDFKAIVGATPEAYARRGQMTGV
ncbi:helix-turn-helix domain-containing protein [Paenibacillus thalictri]|uniref:AraC family transcriptional regulator n=1 Tax=Paenibacillus thalictri TaxID=2527873 RepID=A0A4Q9DPY7_9BACL|nr:helix-turn-helix domain-containing protein [Paenibacillus thalictri]TBL76036.1 AraC family transcriptional regulator [Paenibacillus thalictri]